MLGNIGQMSAPFSFSSYTSELIESQQAQNIGDVLTNDVSVRQGSPGTYGLEFYNVRSFLLNGHDMSFGGMYGISPYGRIPVEMAERVEVLKGPAAMLFGQSPGGAVGGNINIVPKRAEEEPMARVTTTYASDSQFGAHVDVGRRFGLNREWGVRVNGQGSAGHTGLDGQSLNRWLGAVALDYLGKRARFSLDAYDTRYHATGGIGAFASFSTPVIPKAPRTSTNLFPGTFYDSKDVGAVARGEFDLTDWLSVYAGYGERRHDETGYPSSAARNVGPTGNFSGTLNPGKSYNNTKSGEAGVRGRFNTGPIKHDWSFGYSTLRIAAGASTRHPTPFYTSNIYAPTQMQLTTTGYPVLLTSDTNLTGFSLADTMSALNDRVKLIVGARRQEVKVTGYSPVSANSTEVRRSSSYDVSTTTPMFGVVVKPLRSLSVYANYIEGLTSGSTVSDPAATNYGAVIPPLKTKQIEVGTKWDLGRWSHTLALYQITNPSIINVYAGNSYSVDGDGQQRNRGVEYNVFGEVVRSVRLLGGVAYTDGILTRTSKGVNQGNTAFASPHWKLNAGAEWDVGFLPGFTLSALAIYTSSIYLDSANTQMLPSWTRFDLGARYATRVGSTPVTLRFRVQNIANRAYWDASWRDGLAVLSAPRTFLASATVDF
ncbi:TonB-dependent receptor [Caballeronia sp. HLA56]